MKLSTEAGLGPGHIVLDGNQLLVVLEMVGDGAGNTVKLLWWSVAVKRLDESRCHLVRR